MLIGFLTAFFVVLSLLLVFIIFLQKGKSSLGLGNMGGTNQMLFGGSGGQDIFQKTTWVMVALFMSSSLVISKLKSQRLGYKISSKPMSQPQATRR